MAEVTYYLSLPYTKTLKPDEDGDVIATIAELDGCIAHGSDDAEALKNLGAALRAWIEAALADGQEIPLPAKEEELPSGKFVVRLPRHLHRRVNKIAETDDVSLNVIMIMAVTELVTRREVRATLAHPHAHNPYAWKEAQGTWDVTSGGPLRLNYLSHIQRVGIVDAVGKTDRHLKRKT